MQTRKEKNWSQMIATTDPAEDPVTFTILLSVSQKKFLQYILPQGVSMQKCHLRVLYELKEMQRCSIIGNPNIENERSLKQSLWKANLSQSVDAPYSERENLVEVSVKKKTLVLQLIQNMKKIIGKNELVASNFQAQWQSMEEKAKKWKINYSYLFDYLENLIKRMNQMNWFEPNIDLLTKVRAEIQKTKDLLGLFRFKEEKIYMLYEIQTQSNFKEEETIKKSCESMKLMTKKLEKRARLNCKKQRKKKGINKKKAIDCDDTTLSPVLEEVSIQSNAEKTISLQQTMIINNLLRKLNIIDQDRLLSSISHSQKNFLIRNMKQREADNFLSKIKQTLRNNGIFESRRIQNCNQEQESSFEILSESD